MQLLKTTVEAHPSQKIVTMFRCSTIVTEYHVTLKADFSINDIVINILINNGIEHLGERQPYIK